MSKLADNPGLTRLKARLALPERAPDEAFVRRVALEAEVLSMQAQAVRARRGQIAVDVSAAAALLLAARQLGTIAEPAAELLLPVGDGMGTAAVVAALLMLLAAVFGAAREARA
jgi:hypothetical protein